MKKLYAALVPLFAVIAFVAVPAAAQAQPTWEACKEVTKETGKFTTNKCNVEKVKSNFEWEKIGNLSSALLADSNNVAGTEAVLTIPALGAEIKCTTIKDESWLWNRAAVGRDMNEVLFTVCTALGNINKCTVTVPIEVEAYTKLEEKTGKIFNVFYPVAGNVFAEITLSGTGCQAPGTSAVEGTASGEMTAHGNKQKFSGATLTFDGDPAEFKAETEQELSPSKGGVRVS
jgi:hypothetical protein